MNGCGTYRWMGAEPDGRAGEAVKAVQARLKISASSGGGKNLATAANLKTIVGWCQKETPSIGDFPLGSSLMADQVKWSMRLLEYRGAVDEAMAIDPDSRTAAGLHERVTGPLILGLCEAGCRVDLPRDVRTVPDLATPFILRSAVRANDAAADEEIEALINDLLPRCWPLWVKAGAVGFAVLASLALMRGLFR